MNFSRALLIMLLSPGGSKALHGDDWRQVEFVMRTNQNYIQSKLAQLEVFEKQHQRAKGFTDVIVRREHPTRFEAAGFTTAQLPRLTESGLTLDGGTVSGGFALSLAAANGSSTANV